MSIKRFNPAPQGYMDEYRDGKWISYTDHIAALEAVKDSYLAALLSGDGDNIEMTKAAIAAGEAIYADLPQSPWPASDWAIDRIAELEAALEAVKATAEPVKPLLATRFKLSFDHKGRCTTFRKDQAEALFGEWVWLIEATDGVNDPLYSASALETKKIGNNPEAYVTVGMAQDKIEADQQEAINLIEWIEDYALADPDLGEIASRAGKARDLLLALEANQQVIETLRAALELSREWIGILRGQIGDVDMPMSDDRDPAVLEEAVYSKIAVALSDIPKGETI